LTGPAAGDGAGEAMRRPVKKRRQLVNGGFRGIGMECRVSLWKRGGGGVSFREGCADFVVESSNGDTAVNYWGWGSSAGQSMRGAAMKAPPVKRKEKWVFAIMEGVISEGRGGCRWGAHSCRA
jgi:hypothetical protein